MSRSALQFLSLLVAASGGAVLTHWIWPLNSPCGQEIRAKSFSIVDKAGRVQAYWGSSDGTDSSIHFLNSRGAQVIVVGVLEQEWPVINLLGPEQSVRAASTQDAQGSRLISDFLRDECGL